MVLSRQTKGHQHRAAGMLPTSVGGITGTITQEHTAILTAMTIKKLTLNTQLTTFVVERLQRTPIWISDLRV